MASALFEEEEKKLPPSKREEEKKVKEKQETKSKEKGLERKRSKGSSAQGAALKPLFGTEVEEEKKMPPSRKSTGRKSPRKADQKEGAK